RRQSPTDLLDLIRDGHQLGRFYNPNHALAVFFGTAVACRFAVEPVRSQQFGIGPEALFARGTLQPVPDSGPNVRLQSFIYQLFKSLDSARRTDDIGLLSLAGPDIERL